MYMYEIWKSHTLFEFTNFVPLCLSNLVHIVLYVPYYPWQIPYFRNPLKMSKKNELFFF